MHTGRVHKRRRRRRCDNHPIASNQQPISFKKNCYTCATPCTLLKTYSLFSISIILLVAIGCNDVNAKQSIVEHPQNTTVRVGETVVMKCRVEDQKGTLQWIKNGFGLGVDRTLPLLERHTMVGKLNLGEYHLQIRNVTVGDDDLYSCQLAPTDTEQSQDSKTAKLTVLVEPEDPYLLGDFSQPIPAIEGIEMRLSCRSPKGRPAARLGWVISQNKEATKVLHHITNDYNSPNANSTAHPQHHLRNREHVSQQYTGKIVESVDLDEENGFSTVTSNLTFSPTKADNGRYIACLAAHDTYGKEVKSASAQLDVSYRPKIKVEIDENESSAQEGGRLVFRCNVDAKPVEDTTVRWTWNGEDKRLVILDSVGHRTAMLSGLKIKDNNAKVTCSASNSIGTESASIRLNIPYGPRFMSTNQTKLVQNVVSQRQDDLINMGNNYTITNAQEWEAGEYICVASVAGFPSKSLTHRLYLKGPPVVFLNEEMIQGNNGAMSLSCEIQSRTLPIKVNWMVNGRVIDADRERSRFLIQNSNKDFGMESRLTIHQFSSLDYGLYNCSAQNEFGSNSDQYDVFDQTFWEKIKQYSDDLPVSYRLALLVIVICLVVCALMICCMKCTGSLCCSGKSKSSNFSHDHGDVIVNAKP
uniref:Ig-like domain-containing protein n=1 Tax=Ditylenchus dipsaci TaxID=166011 RepID=A0A915E080_9BILA